MSKFIDLKELKLQKADMQQVVGGGPEIVMRYAVITPKYGIKPQPLYGITPMPLYGIIIPMYGITVDVEG